LGLSKDIWRIGLVQAPIAACVDADSLSAQSIRWLDPGPDFTFLADPFGLWRDGRLHVFAEAYDYRTRHGVIDWLQFNSDLALEARQTILREPWHLSYPFIVEDGEDIWMAPEAFRSGSLTLYRAAAFPNAWEAVGQFELDTPAIDPTIFQHGDLWWMAYSPTGNQAAKQGRLHLAFAERLTGPWTPHASNPVRENRRGSRPGGTPFTRAGKLFLPVQDCSATYGGALRLLRIDEITPTRFAAELGPPIRAPASATPFVQGMHTLSSCGPITLVDAKRVDWSPRGMLIGLARRLREPTSAGGAR